MGSHQYSQRVGVDKSEIGYLHDEVYHGRSALSGNMMKLAFTLWDLSGPATTDNIVLLTRDEADAHDRGGGKTLYARDVQERIEQKIRAHTQWTALFR